MNSVMLVVGLGVLLCMGVSYWMGVSGRLAERIAELWWKAGGEGCE